MSLFPQKVEYPFKTWRENVLSLKIIEFELYLIYHPGNMHLDIIIMFKSFHPQLLMDSFPFWCISECLNLF